MDQEDYQVALSALIARGGSACAVRRAMNLLIITYGADPAMLEAEKPLRSLMMPSSFGHQPIPGNRLDKCFREYVRSLIPLPVDVGSMTFGALIEALERLHATGPDLGAECLTWYARMRTSRKGATIAFLTTASGRIPSDVVPLVADVWSDLGRHQPFITCLINELEEVIGIPCQFYRGHDLLAFHEDELFLDVQAAALRRAGASSRMSWSESSTYRRQRGHRPLKSGLAIVSLDALVRELTS